jgi:integrase
MLSWRKSMALSKQAKTLTTNQINKMLDHLKGTRYPTRNRCIALLSCKAGLRAKEIADLKWGMVLNPEGNLSDSINLTNDASKGKNGGRVIPLNSSLKESLENHKDEEGEVLPHRHIIHTERNSHTTPNAIAHMFKAWYKRVGFDGCSSHSGRRTFITNAAKKVGFVGGSIRDIQALAGHSSIQNTQRYIDQDVEAQKKLVNMI